MIQPIYGAQFWDCDSRGKEKLGFWETDNRKDDVSLEVWEIPGGAQDQSSMEKAEPKDEQFQVLMRTFESLDPSQLNP